MTLHVEIQGTGAPLLLIHGWGMHGGLWGELVARLAQDFQVITVDLPGHGLSRDCVLPHPSPLPVGEGFDSLPSAGEGMRVVQDLDGFVDVLAAQFPEPLNVCGWSLGGQIALRWATRFPSQIQKLILLSSTPCFVQQPAWDCAMSADTLAGFAEALQQDYALTLRRFLALQVRGSENEKALLLRLRQALFSRGEPDQAILQRGLGILRDCDLRADLPRIAQPTLVIGGERDTLTPPQASAFLAQQLPNAQLHIVHGAAHAPFLSHPDAVVQHINTFL
ncbi:MAG: alpha/beta fold hydrolase [Gallionella sp.]|nr:alpha/beta fold hydrolase [Gallionella sp.]MDD4958735.1 alpha/beta fold hydrolase [Gallionella sp.]